VGGIIALNLTRMFMDRVLITQCNNSREVTDKRNLAAGAVEFDATAVGEYQLRAGIVDSKGRTISENIFEFEVRE